MEGGGGPSPSWPLENRRAEEVGSVAVRASVSAGAKRGGSRPPAKGRGMGPSSMLVCSLLDFRPKALKEVLSLPCSLTGEIAYA